MKQQTNIELDAKVGEYIRQKHFFMTCGDSWSVGKLKFVKDLSCYYSTPKHRRQLPLTACVEGRGNSLYNAIVDAIQNSTQRVK